MSTITIGPISLDKVRRYRASRHLVFGTHSIPAIPESGQLVDEETYSFHRPEYFIQARVTENLRRQIERLYEDQTAEAYNDTISTDTVQMVNYRHNHQMGYDEHMVTVILSGSSA
jgi:hypothetical protein